MALRQATGPLLAPFLLCVAAAHSEPSAAPATCSWGPVQPLRHEVFSVAAGLHILNVNDGEPDRHEPFLRLLGELRLPVLRLPGGNSMNRWSWTAGRDRECPNAPALNVPAWTRLAREGGSEPLWGINVLGPVSETEHLCAEIQRRGLSAHRFRFELGNELYIRHWDCGLDDYLERAAKHAAVLRRHFPQAVLGCPVSSLWGLWKGRQEPPFGFKPPDRLRAWHRAVSAAPFCDALVLHIYLTPKELDDYRGCSRQDVIDWARVRSGRQATRETFDAASALAPKKEIWVTEWGFNTSQYIQRHPKERRWHAHQTMLAVLHDAGVMLNTAVHCPRVTVMTNWTLVNQPAVALYRTDTGPTVKAALFRLLDEAREGCDGIAAGTLAVVPSLPGPARGLQFAHLNAPVVDAFGFFRGKILLAALVLNVSESPQRLRFPKETGRARSGTSLHAASLLPEWGNPDNPSARSWNPPRRITELEVRKTVLTVPPASLSLLRFAPPRGENGEDGEFP